MSGYLASPVEVLEQSDTTAVARMVVAADDPVFAGHFPDFPIFPGVAVVEFAHRAATATGGLRLAAIESTRFVRPTLPGTTLTVHVTWDDAGRRCAAAVSDADGVVARVKLRYEPC
ncbi:3-hydroxyacyl-ACP dehydratase FabZ family protein [Saccharothrix sp. NRRL B-16348]|uniref:3-hydroxyacyl-ACP dehydratase FabZ family protein n=1 Tax=Saccharothrix sp. NRRL B-16348 TaxID=1415542 RepID=UPI0006ADF086|nr:beta-hydroxyacyl-ACP dehydratase [Saccharothrix sp. NRRL B-16348]